MALEPRNRIVAKAKPPRIDSPTEAGTMTTATTMLVVKLAAKSP
jgi:hypothetical protein